MAWVGGKAVGHDANEGGAAGKVASAFTAAGVAWEVAGHHEPGSADQGGRGELLEAAFQIEVEGSTSRKPQA